MNWTGVTERVLANRVFDRAKAGHKMSETKGRLYERPPNLGGFH